MSSCQIKIPCISFKSSTPNRLHYLNNVGKKNGTKLREELETEFERRKNDQGRRLFFKVV